MLGILLKGFTNTFDFLGRVFVYNNNPPKDVDSIKNIAYSPHSRYNKLDVHYPRGNKSKLPIFIYIHGGGWSIGHKNNYTKLCKTIANNGFLVVNINYRLGPKYSHPSQIEDVISVLSWIKENSNKYNGDINRVVIGGDSAGGHLSSLAACLCTNEDLRNKYGLDIPISENQLSGLVLIYGAYNFNTLIDTRFPAIKHMIESYTGTYNLKDYKYKDQISPIDHVLENYPPTFITSGEIDRLHSQALEMIEVLEDRGIKHEKLLFEKTSKDAQHGFINFHKRECTKVAYKSMIRFLKNNSKLSIDA